MSRVLWTVIWMSLLNSVSDVAAGEPEKTASRRVARLFIQDHESASVKWVDVTQDPGHRFGTVQAIADFPMLDTQKQKLVQMRQAGDYLVVGIRDEENGGFGSGYALVRTGVELHEHGDHEDWVYAGPPETWQTVLDDQQGNPAHVYESGYTRINPREYFVGRDGKRVLGSGGFHRGGGKHITLAVASGSVGYSSWIDREGEYAGQVDVTAIKAIGNNQVAYSFHLPSGGIHGLTTCGDKIFFAPSDGVCWCQADVKLAQKSEEVAIHQLSLGTDDKGKPRRTGAFETHRGHVLFVTGSGADATVGVIDGDMQKPTITNIAIEMETGNRPTTPQAVRTSNGQDLAFVFHNHAQDVEVEDYLTVIDLDPDKDGKFVDAKPIHTMKVGPSKVEGHFGHHAIAFDASGRFAFYTVPGTGELTAFSLDDLKTAGTITVGGCPTHIVAHGGPESDH